MEDEACTVSPFNLFRRQEQICLICNRQDVTQVLHELASLKPSSDVLLNEEGVHRSLLKVELVEVARLVASEEALDQD